MSAAAAIYRTSIAHVRRTPLHNAFTYRSYSWYVDVDGCPAAPAAASAGRFLASRTTWVTRTGTLRGNVERVPGHPRASRSTAAGSPCWPAPGYSGTCSTR